MFFLLFCLFLSLIGSFSCYYLLPKCHKRLQKIRLFVPYIRTQLPYRVALSLRADTGCRVRRTVVRAHTESDQRVHDNATSISAARCRSLRPSSHDSILPEDSMLDCAASGAWSTQDESLNGTSSTTCPRANGHSSDKHKRRHRRG
jgi:hypothetical protein